MFIESTHSLFLLFGLGSESKKAMEDIMEDYPLDDVENEDGGAPEESATAEGNCFEQEEAGEKVTPYTKKRVVQNPRPKLNKDSVSGKLNVVSQACWFQRDSRARANVQEYSLARARP